jgi:hypothetical protein
LVPTISYFEKLLSEDETPREGDSFS